nr:MAG TPA: hypothetical protein [Herelleviridae sp.]
MRAITCCVIFLFKWCFAKKCFNFWRYGRNTK